MPRPETHSRKLERALRLSPDHELTIAKIHDLGIGDVRKAVKGLERKAGLRLERSGGSWEDPEAVVTLMGRKGRSTPAANAGRAPGARKVLAAAEPPATFTRTVADFSRPNPHWETRRHSRNAAKHPPTSAGIFELHLTPEGLQRATQRLALGEIVPYRIRKAITNGGGKLTYFCKGCGHPKKQTGPCGRCGEEEAQAIHFAPAGQDAPIHVSLLPDPDAVEQLAA
jgi:hypothetical protein